MRRFVDKIVVVTGAASGIGLATARAFLSEAKSLSFNNERPPDFGSGALRLVLDASCEAQVKRCIDSVVGEFGRIDVLFNNCGIGANLDARTGRAVVMQTTEQAQDADIDFVLANNLKSAIWFVKYGLRHMPKNDGSCIMSSSSIWSEGRIPGAVAYTASKAALTAVTVSWAYSHAPIRAVALVLGAIDTPMFRSNPTAALEIATRTLLRRVGRPEEVAEAVLFIASCRYLTATEIILDGGNLGR